MKRRAVIIVTLLAMTAFLVPTTQAADEKITGRVVAHYTKMETMEVGDIPGHVLGIARQSGLMFYSTGEVAKKAATFHFDLMKGKGTFVDYSLYTDTDGATRFLKAPAQRVRWVTGKSSLSRERLSALVVRENTRGRKEPERSKGYALVT